MIKLENVVLASPEQMKFIIEGSFSSQWCGNTPRYIVGENDHSLMQRLSNAGTDHRKFMRMMPVYVRITAPLYW